MTREFPDRPIPGVGVVVLGAKGVLLVKRAKPPRQGQWSLPGGAQKLGETVFEAARRETLEETGLEIEVLGLIDVVDSIASDDGDDNGGGEIRYHYTLIDVLAVAAGDGTGAPGPTLSPGPSPDPVAGSDAEDVAWFPLQKIPGLKLWSETERIINLAVEMKDALAAVDD